MLNNVNTFSGLNNYFSIETFNTLDRRILVLASFVLGCISTILLQYAWRGKKSIPNSHNLSNTVKKPSVVSAIGSSSSSFVKNSKTHVSAPVSQSSQKSSQKVPQQPQPKPVPQPPQQQPVQVPSVPQPIVEKEITLCYRAVLETEGAINTDFVNKFFDQLDDVFQKRYDQDVIKQVPNLKKYKFKRVDITKDLAPLKKVKGDCIVAYFSNCKSRLQDKALNSEMNTETEKVRKMLGRIPDLSALFLLATNGKNPDGFINIQGNTDITVSISKHPSGKPISPIQNVGILNRLVVDEIESRF